MWKILFCHTQFKGEKITFVYLLAELYCVMFRAVRSYERRGIHIALMLTLNRENLINVECTNNILHINN